MSLGIVAFAWVFLRSVPVPSPHLRKLLEMFLALVSIQTAGAYVAQTLGPALGGGFSGFIGGFVSSTAMTAETARNSRRRADEGGVRMEFVRFLAANLAMLSETFALAFLGIDIWTTRLWCLFSLPIAFSAWSVYRETRVALASPSSLPIAWVSFSSNLKLAAVLALLSVSFFYIRKWFGDGSLFVVTFLSSLFEVHAVTIANVGLAGDHGISSRALADLIAVSLAASFVSKLFIVASAGSAAFVRLVARWLAKLAAALALAWAAFVALDRFA